MNRLPRWLACLPAFLLWAAVPVFAQDQLPPPQFQGAQPPDTGQQNGVEVLTRGMIHEAFATPTVFDPKPGIVVPRKPPDPVEELPPDEKPEGSAVAWIPGYWAWDTDRSDFIWISGFWRDIPPGRQWVPGYWTQVNGGWQWVSGFWASTDVQQITYLPAPPPTLDNGPNTLAQSDNQIWSPGYWFWEDTRYVWRPGFWVTNQPNWTWVPARYSWAPAGYAFVDGYWDYAPMNRGLLYAPVYFNQPLYSQAGYSYTPNIALNLLGVLQNLFIGPRYGGYYFGNYYGSSTYLPWYAFNYRYGYDPFLPYYGRAWYGSNWRYSARNPAWMNQIRQAYVQRQQNPALQPAVTYQAQRTRVTNTNVNNTTVNNNATVNNVNIAAPAKQVITQNANLKVQKLTPQQRQQIAQQTQLVRQSGTQRHQVEAKAAAQATTASHQAVHLALPKTAIAAHTAAAATTTAPPPHPEAAIHKALRPTVGQTPAAVQTTQPRLPAVQPKTPVTVQTPATTLPRPATVQTPHVTQPTTPSALPSAVRTPAAVEPRLTVPHTPGAPTAIPGRGGAAEVPKALNPAIRSLTPGTTIPHTPEPKVVPHVPPPTVQPRPMPQAVPHVPPPAVRSVEPPRVAPHVPEVRTAPARPAARPEPKEKEREKK